MELRILFENETDFRFPVYEGDVDGNASFPNDPEQMANLVLRAVLLAEGCPVSAECSIMITDEGSMREINRDMRGIDAVTDVLSFPAFAYETESDFAEALADPFAKDPDSGCLLLGDIVLCAERVLSQAKEYGHSVRREYAFLLAHSMLHLLGYDHEDEEERARMFRRQEEILDGLGITREQ